MNISSQEADILLQAITCMNDRYNLSEDALKLRDKLTKVSKRIFTKDGEGNWVNTATGFTLGTSDSIYADMVNTGQWTVSELIDHLMNNVNDSME